MFETLSARMEGVFNRLRGRGRLSASDVERALSDIRTALLEADVEAGVADGMLDGIRERAVGAEVMKNLAPGMQVVKLVNEALVATLGEEAEPLLFADRGPTVMMLVGLQGSGKTTSAAKLAWHVRHEGRRPMLAAADLQRPAAVEQLRRLGEQMEVPVFTAAGKDPVRLVKRAAAHVSDQANGLDVLIVDTAGRLAVDRPLMEELSRISAAARPQETLLVLDAMTGQDAVRTARGFLEHAPFTGVLLSKLDGDARGGAAISVRAATGKPIKLAGVGERPPDLEVFRPRRMASRILGMGDVMTIIEKAERAIDQEQAAQVAGRIMRAEVTLDDFLFQIKGMRRMGSMGELAGMLPGAQAVSLDAEAAERESRRMEAIILSMTPSERKSPKLIDGSRRRRIAAGSGTTVQAVSAMLRQFDKMRKMLPAAVGEDGANFLWSGSADLGLARPLGRGLRRKQAARRPARPTGGTPRTPKKNQKKKR